MSLTNPNKVVTEQRLNEYHNAILPYLGGMPEIVANKFSKGDLYSTEERMIGQWIDGKPLYQKVVDFGTLPNNTEKEVAHNISNIENVISLFGLSRRSSDTTYHISMDIFQITEAVQCRSTTIYIKTTDYRSDWDITKIILQYTKTTDSPISIGSDTDYSTEEKIVGTWIDGKPLYQKIITGTLQDSLNTQVTAYTFPNNIDNIFIDSGFTEVNFSNGAILHGSLIDVGENGNFLNRIILQKDGTPSLWKIITSIGAETRKNQLFYILVKYTKTTD